MIDPRAELTRRRCLAWAGVALAPAWGSRWAWAQQRLTQDPFALGVASGFPQPNTVVLWTRLMLSPAQASHKLAVHWELALDERFAQIVQQGEAWALPELAHAVHVEPQGLAPDRVYHYRFRLGDATSAVGRTRTTPALGAEVQRLRLVYASCQRWEHGHFAAWRHVVADEPDVVLFLGDYIYEYPGAAQAVRTVDGGWVLTLDDYRRRYALYKSDAALQAAHAACPWLMTWDDHEVHNDYAGQSAGDSGPPVDDFAARRAAAYQAYYEHMPLPARMLTRALVGLAQGAELRLYGSTAWGRLAQLNVLDARQYKDPQVCTQPSRRGSRLVDPSQCADWQDAQRSLLGAAQERWLGEQLGAARGGAWNILAQQSLLGPRDFKSGPGQTLWNDGWDGYAAARTRLTQTLAQQRTRNAVCLGGDVHENWVGHILADYARPDSTPVGVEFCGTSISSRSGGNAKLAAHLAENPHFVFADAQRKGYGLADFTPQRLTTTLRVVQDVTQADSGAETLARFVVESGQPKVVPG